MIFFVTYELIIHVCMLYINKKSVLYALPGSVSWFHEVDPDHQNKVDPDPKH